MHDEVTLVNMSKPKIVWDVQVSTYMGTMASPYIEELNFSSVLFYGTTICTRRSTQSIGIQPKLLGLRLIVKYKLKSKCTQFFRKHICWHSKDQ